jgi:hypothetical protein
MYACLLQPINVIGQPYLRGVWLSVDLRMYITKAMCGLRRLN